MPRLDILRLATLVWFALTLAAPAVADTLQLTGRLVNGNGHPLPDTAFRLVLGSEADPRGPQAGRVLTTDAGGRFALTAPVTLRARRIRLDNWLVWHDAQLLELGIGLDLAERPALYWVEVDFTRHGPVRGIAAHVAGANGVFDRPLTFHRREHAWSFPDDPRGMRLSGIGADLRIEDWSAGAGGVWRLDVVVVHQSFAMR